MDSSKKDLTVITSCEQLPVQVSPESSIGDNVINNAGSVSESMEKENNENADDANAVEIPFQTKAIIAILMLLTLMCSFETTSISVSLPYMTDDLNGTSTQAVWVGAAFLLTSAVFQPLISSLSEIFGRLALTMTSISFFFIGSAVGGSAPNMTAVIIGRALQGVGAGGILSLVEIIIADLIPLRVRGVYYSLLGCMWAIGGACGPLMGGGFTSKVTWRWILYINLPIAGICAGLTPIFLCLQLQEKSFKQKLKEIDYIGMIIFTSAGTSLLLGISFGGVMYPWKSYNVILPLILGFVGIIAFGFYEAYYAKYPMIRLAIFLHPVAIFGYVQIILHAIVFCCILYFLPYYFEGVKGYSALISGVAILPMSVTCSPSSILSGYIINWTGKYALLSWISWAILTAGTGILVCLKPENTAGQNIGYLILGGFGTGLIFTISNIIVLVPNTNENTPYAASMLSFLRVLGQSFGVAIGGSVFSNTFAKQLVQYPELKASLQGYSGGDPVGLIKVVSSMPDSENKTLLVNGLSSSIQMVWWCMLAFASAGFLLNIFIRDMSMNIEYEAAQNVVSKPEKDIEKN